MTQFRVLVVHDDPDGLGLMVSMLRSGGHEIIEAENDRQAVRLLEREGADLLIAGVDPDNPDALELLSYARRKHHQMPVILLMTRRDPDRIQEAQRMKAASVLRWPLPASELRAAVTLALQQARPRPVESTGSLGQAHAYGNGHPPTTSFPSHMPAHPHSNGADGYRDHEQDFNPIAPSGSVGSNTRTELSELPDIGELSLLPRFPDPENGPPPTRQAPGGGTPMAPVVAVRHDGAGLVDGTEPLVGRDPGFQQALSLARAVAASAMPVLLVGERGTGKTRMARRIHEWSPRRLGPLVELSCRDQGVPALESALFGVAPGIASHGGQSVAGRIAHAHGGTLVLDEVSEMPVEIQERLARFFQDGTFLPIGSDQSYRADVRVIMTSRVPLGSLVEQGFFREDLYYRVCAVTLRLPPLRRRLDDLDLLAEHFRDQFARQLGKSVIGFAPESLRMLHAHRWPGNLSELASVVERGVLLSTVDLIRPDALMVNLSEAVLHENGLNGRDGNDPNGASQGSTIMPLKEALEEPEKQIILRALEALNWNRQETARVLDINRTTLYKKMKKYGLLTNDEPTCATP